MTDGWIPCGQKPPECIVPRVLQLEFTVVVHRPMKSCCLRNRVDILTSEILSRNGNLNIHSRFPLGRAQLTTNAEEWQACERTVSLLYYRLPCRESQLGA